MPANPSGRDADPKYTVLFYEGGTVYKLLRKDWMVPSYILTDPFAQGVAEQLRAFGAYMARINKVAAPLTEASSCTFINVCAMQGSNPQPPGSSCAQRCSSLSPGDAPLAAGPKAQAGEEAVMLAGDDGEFYVLQREDWHKDDFVMQNGAGEEIAKRLVSLGCSVANIPTDIAPLCGEICTLVNLESIFAPAR